MTGPGHEVTHICKCIEIALRSQCMVYPVITNGVYEGTAILGCGYTMYVNDIGYRPVAYDELLGSVTSGSQHSSSIEKIIRITSDEGNRDDIAATTSMRQLALVLKEIPLDDTQRSGIVKAAHNLSYSSRYWLILD